jgi:hypothetical protein
MLAAQPGSKRARDAGQCPGQHHRNGLSIRLVVAELAVAELELLPQTTLRDAFASLAPAAELASSAR